MTGPRAKRVEWRPQARVDAAEGATWYTAQGGLELGEHFLQQVEATLSRLSEFPGIGSTRHAWCVPNLPEPLRFFPVSRFDRYLVYYLDWPDHVEVIRIWNAARGLDALMETS
ncbi:MAG TPA: type II toxin-antitoxin system RelE/ParE family toxin [Nevskiaceae bacterium]|nr:type II toxin-antitoxin system RelE/ParE family toxin [Nevskiaceae bacterium]